MADIQLYAKMPGSTTFTLLDLHASEPIKLSLSVQDIQDPLAATSIFSRTFKVPNTGVNAPFFKSVFNVNSTDFDASQKADAYILDNGMLQTSGNIRLVAIYTSDYDGKVEYEITFYGETSDFGSKIGGGFLNQLDFTQYNHVKTYNNILASWTNGLFSGDVVYGLIEWGYTYNNDNQPLQPTLSNGFNNSFTVSSKALHLEQWKPQFRAKAIWDTIFEESGYTYDSVFLDSTLFKKMYVISENVASATLDRSNLFEASNFSAEYGVIGNITQPINTPNETFDSGNSFNPVTSTYTAPTAGLYEFQYDSLLYVGTGPFYSVTAGIQLKILNSAGATISSSPPTNIYEGTNDYSETVSIYLTAGQTVRFAFGTFCISGSCYTGSTELNIYNQTLRCITAPNILSINSIMPSNVRKIDFMRSIINRFRLVFVPSREKANHFIITPWKDWILQGNAIDWSNKLDTSKDLKITPLFYGQDRFQVYKDQEDGDFLNFNYQLAYKQTVGQLNLDSTNELIKGTKTTQDQFAPTPIAPIGFKDGDLAGSRFLIPHIAKDTGSSEDTTGTTIITGKREPIQPKLRLIFYNGLIAAPLTWYARTTNVGSGTSYATLNAYPLMSPYSSWPITNSTLDLNWENEPPFWDITDSYLGTGNTQNANFNTYWKTWYDTTFDPFSRIVEANIILDYQDVLDLKFNDYVFIKDAWYFVNKITDYIVGQNTNCRVELVKVGNIGITLPLTSSQYLGVNLCRANLPCDAYCCFPGLGVSNLYWINGVDLANSQTVFADATGTTYAPSGYYSDGVVIVFVGGSGVITEITLDPDCSCAQDGFEFTGTTSGILCNVCCDLGTAIVVYGANATFLSNGYLYLNAPLTIPAPAGWYLIPGQDPVEVGANGQIIAVGSCASCICDVFYPYTVCYSADLCESCCCTYGSTVVWSTSSTFLSSANLYSSNTLTSPAPAGYYKLSGGVTSDALQVTGSLGAVTAVATCTTCPPCPTSPVNVEVRVKTFVGGYTSNGVLEASSDGGVTWGTVGVVGIAPGDGPADITTTFGVPEEVLLRCRFTSDVLVGTMDTKYYENTVVIDANSATTPGFFVQLGGADTVAAVAYKFEAIIDSTAADEVIYVGGLDDAINSSYKGDPYFPGTTDDIRSILGLNKFADIFEPFNVSTGFGIVEPKYTEVRELEWVNETQMIVAGNFTSYKGSNVTQGLVILNTDGTLNTSFNTTRGAYTSYSGSAFQFDQVWTVDIAGGIAYVGGNFEYWDEGSLGGASDLYFASPRMVAINIADGLINTGFTSLFPAEIGSAINKIRVYSGKIYVASNIGSYGGVPIPVTSNGLIRLNMDGTRDTTFAGDVNMFGGVTDFVFSDDGNYIYATIPTKVLKINRSNGTIVTAFNTATSGNTIYSIEIDSTGLYIGGNFYSVDGVTRNGIAKLDFNGDLITAFNPGTGFYQSPSLPPPSPAYTNYQVYDILSDNAGSIYVAGMFISYNGTTSQNLIKLDSTTAAIVTQFDVNTGFVTGRQRQALLSAGGTPAPTYYPLELCHSVESYCNAYCCITGSETYWSTATTLGASLNLYTDSAGSTSAVDGYYSDGTTIALQSGGVIVAFYDPGTCSCGGAVLNAYDVSFSTDVCTACCGNPVPAVYTASLTWSGSAILYANATGTTFVAPGYYNYGGVLLEVTGSGVVIAVINCDEVCDCLPSPCYRFLVTNDHPTATASVSYTDCNSIFQFQTIPHNSEYATTCTTYAAISITGLNTNIQLIGDCVPPPPFTCSKWLAIWPTRSGESLSFSYINCQNETIYETFYWSPGQSTEICVKNGTIPIIYDYGIDGNVFQYLPEVPCEY